MNKSKTAQSIKNISTVMILKILQIILPFLSRTILIKKMGLEYVGLSGLFTSIIGVLSLAEMGVGSALIYAMYKPIQEKDNAKICAILNLYKKAYLLIGVLVTILGLIVSIFIDKLIKPGTYPNTINIRIVFYIYLLNTVITYLVYAYKASLLDAHQMGYIATKFKIKMLFVQYMLQIVLLMIISNYYIYVFIMPLCTFISCYVIGEKASKIFPEYNTCGKLEKREKSVILKKIQSLFLYKIGSIVLNSVDSIIISWYFGAVILGIYNNYYYIVSSLFSLLISISAAITPSIGNSLATDSKDKNYRDFMMFSAGYSFGIGVCTVCIICLMQPFITFWIGSDNLLPLGCVFLFGVYFYCFRMGDVVGWYKDAAGLWEPDKFRPIISSVINLVLNIVLIQKIGIYGVLLSTILSLLCINYPIAVKVLLKYFEKTLNDYIKMIARSICAVIVASVISYNMCQMIEIGNMFVLLLVRGVVSLIVSSLIIYLMIRTNAYFKAFRKFMIRIIKKEGVTR